MRKLCPCTLQTTCCLLQLLKVGISHVQAKQLAFESQGCQMQILNSAVEQLVYSCRILQH